MAYIGVPPADRTSGARVRDEFTADGTQVCFQLSQEVPGSFESNIIAIVENVIQEPVSAYTIINTVTLSLTNISDTFVLNETVTGGTSSAEGTVIQVNLSNVVVRVTSGTFQNSEEITGDDSGATADTSAVDTNVGRGVLFSGTPTTGSAIYVLHQNSATYQLKPAAGSVTPDTLSENLRTFTVDKFTATSSQTAFTLSATPVSVKSILVFVDGVMQTETTHYTLSGAVVTMGSALTTGQQVTVVHLGFSTVSRTAFADSTVTTAMIADNAITSDKIAPGTVIASDVADGTITATKLASTLDLSGKTITYRTIVEGDIASNAITNAKIADDAVGVAELSATGTADSTTFLRGDNSWAVVAVTPTAVSDQANTSTGYFTLPAGTTAERPGSPVAGMIRHNTDNDVIETYDGSSWVAVGDQSTPYAVQYLVIAGGGGGGYYYAGGGGAGGYRSSVSGESSGGGASAESAVTVTPNASYTVTIGAGGSGSGASGTMGSNGSNSVFDTITSIGGGGGASMGIGSSGAGQAAGASGGSGGGGNAETGYWGAGGSGTSGQGYAGGTTTSSNGAGGGGGGAGSVGTGNAGSSSTPRPGGNGVSSSITGSSVTRAVGGNGGQTGTSNAGGSNTGTGGTGGGSGGTGATGGSGVVILRYSGIQRGTGGTVSSSGGYTIHTFTSSGTFTA